LLDYCGISGIRFTLPFGKAITIGTTSKDTASSGRARDVAGTPPRLEAVDGQDSFSGFREIKRRATSLPAGNEGVGEHVRTKSHLGLRPPVKLRTFGSAPNEETCFFCRTGLPQERALSKMTIQPFDLMSRRHPLSSTRAFGFKFASRSKLS
jgi:hypothetical protein